MSDFVFLQVKLKRLMGLNLTALRLARGLPALAGPDRASFVGRCGPEFRGKSAPVSLFGDTFDFAADRAGWHWGLISAPELLQDLVLEFWCDRGDAAPVLLWSFDASLDWKLVTGTEFRTGTIAGRDGLTLELEMRATPLFTPTGTLQVARSAPDLARVVNTLAQQWMVLGELTEVKGLYQATVNDQERYTGYREVAGYTGSDGEGRIYLDHDLNGNWTPGHQTIGLSVRFHARNGIIPIDAVAIWKIILLNDPSDDDEEVHREAAECLDPITYQAPYGAAPAHQGVAPDPPWEQVGGFALTVLAGGGSARTTVEVGPFRTTATSSVILHCPDVGGDTFAISVDLGTGATGVQTGGMITGPMTMWRRVNVEYVRMAQAFELPVARVADYFWGARIQLDFTPARLVAGTPYFAETKDESEAIRDQFVEDVFTHKRQADWFCLIAACQQFNVQLADAQLLAQGTAQLDANGQKLTFDRPPAWVDPAPPVLGSMVVAWDELGSSRLRFNIARTEFVDGGTRVCCTLFAHDINSEFTGAGSDGSLEHNATTHRQYFLRCHESPKGRWIRGGYGAVPDHVRFRAMGKGASYVAGVSPTVVAAGKDRFAGRTIVFTHHGAYAETVEGRLQPRATFEDGVLTTITHELTHAFGMPHKCGFWNWKTPREKTCSLNYKDHGMLLPNGLLDRTGAGRTSPSLCGRHFKQLRYVKLSRNPAFGWPP